MVQIVITKVGHARGTKTFRFNSLEQGSAFMVKYNLSHRIIDIIS